MWARVLNLRNWMADAGCRGADFEFVPTTETYDGLASALTWCNVCPVREECLLTAMKNGWSGYWGGTMTAERARLKAPKHRVKCPLCKAVNLIKVDTSQVCVACGRSWPVGPSPAVHREKRPSELSADPQEEEVMVVGDAL